MIHRISPIRHIKPIIRALRARIKTRTLIALGILVILLPAVFIYNRTPTTVAAEWMDEGYSYRQRFTFTHNADITTDRAITFSLDTAELITNGVMQSDCDDTRFTDVDGNVLQYDLTGTCNNAATTYEVIFPKVFNDVNAAFVYYGNASAVNAEIDSTTYTALTPSGGDPAITTRTAEEKGPGPVAWWKFDEGVDNTCSGGTNDICDQSSNTNDGAITSATWQTEDLCVSGKCLNFDGSNDQVDFGDVTSFDGLTTITISAWIKPQSFPDEGTIVRKWASGQQSFSMGLTSTTEYSSHKGIRFLITDGTNSRKWYSDDGTLTANKWHYVTAVWSGTTSAQIYIDGVAVTTNTANIAGSGSPSSINNGTEDLSVGARDNNNVPDLFFDGFIDEVKIYNYARTAAQVKADFNARGSSQGATAVLGAASTAFLNDGLVGYWKMDESSGNASDSSGNTTTLTNVSTTALTGAKFGNGAEPDGVADYFDAVDNSALSLTGDVVISAWIEPDVVTGSQDIIGKFDGANESYLLALSADEVRMYVDSSSNYETTDAANLVADTKYHVVGVYDASTSTVKLYVNGDLKASTTTGTIPASIGDDAGEFTIGAEDSSTTATNFFNGHIDEARVYNRALSAKEVRDLYNWAPGPVGYWNMDEGSGTGSNALLDRSSNGNHGTMQASMTEDDWVAGKIGGGLEFDGSNDSITITDDPDINFGTGSFTVEAWVKKGTVASQRTFVQKLAGTTSPGYALYQHNSDSVAFLISESGTNYDAAYATAINDGQWHHIAGVANYETGQLYVYRDGVKGTPANITITGTTTDTENLNFASKWGAFDGIMDEVKLYNYARTPGQIIEDMNAGHPIGGSPVGSQTIYYKFDEQYGTTANDTIGNQNGTVDSNLTWLTNTTCKVNGCLSWDAAGEEVSIATANDAPVDFNGSEEFSGSAWVYVTTMPGSGNQDAIIAKWDGTTAGTDAYRLVVENDDADTTGNFQVEVMDASASQSITASTANDLVSVNTWYHVGFTFNGGTAGAADDLKLYIDGIERGTNSANASFLGLEDVSADFTIGEYDATDVVANNTAFTGYIDEVKIYSTALTAEQVKIDYNAGSSINYSTGQNEAADLTDGAGNPPVGHWSMDENTGSNANDISGNGSTGTFSGSPSWTRGKYGSAVSFDGSSDYIDVANESNFDFTNAYTFEAWVKPSSTQIANSNIFRKESGIGGYGIEMNGSANSNTYYAGWKSSSGNECWGSNSFSLTANTWQHLVVVKSGTSRTVYIDGNLSNTCTGSASDIVTNNVNLRLADWGSANRPWAGEMDQVKIYDYARTPAQIAYDYNRGRPVGWWKLDECQGATAYDASGNANNGTITIGGTGNNTAIGTCGSGTSTEAWNNGTTGKRNASLEFDDTDDEITVADDNALDLTAGLSISAWVNTDADEADNVIVSKGTSYEMGIDGSANLYWDGVGAQANDGSASVGSGAWHHVVVTNDDTTATYYVDGVSTGTDAAGIDADNATALRIGYDGTNFFDGQIDDVRIYNYVLTAAQIKKIMNEGAVRFGPDTGSP